MCFGLLIIIVGVIFLLQNLGIINGAVWPILWPILVIAVGFCFLFKKKRHGHMCGEFKERMQEKFGEKEK